MNNDNTLGLGLAGNSYLGRNKYGQLAMFGQDNLQYAQPGSIQTANIDGVVYPGTTQTDNANSKGLWDSTKELFTPQAGSSTSTGGQILGGIGAGIQGVTSGLAAYFTKKNYDLQKDNQKYLQAREAQSDARKSQFAANAGNNATY